MKKLLSAIAISSLLVGCGSSNNDNPTPPKPPTPKVEDQNISVSLKNTDLFRTGEVALAADFSSFANDEQEVPLSMFLIEAENLKTAHNTLSYRNEQGSIAKLPEICKVGADELSKINLSIALGNGLYMLNVVQAELEIKNQSCSLTYTNKQYISNADGVTWPLDSSITAETIINADMQVIDARSTHNSTDAPLFIIEEQGLKKIFSFDLPSAKNQTVVLKELLPNNDYVKSMKSRHVSYNGLLLALKNIDDKTVVLNVASGEEAALLEGDFLPVPLGGSHLTNITDNLSNSNIIATTIDTNGESNTIELSPIYNDGISYDNFNIAYTLQTDDGTFYLLKNGDLLNIDTKEKSYHYIKNKDEVKKFDSVVEQVNSSADGDHIYFNTSDKVYSFRTTNANFEIDMTQLNLSGEKTEQMLRTASLSNKGGFTYSIFESSEPALYKLNDIREGQFPVQRTLMFSSNDDNNKTILAASAVR
ncbi:hypothetical protein [Psychromonas aquimarina]|uniref:hypothetical protein n=1 Tax=Psychromonas aquimarina TaxID=444919 RepID=UPI00042A0944|nr:hypothetical protein [Psychromonas aquimarina]